MATESDFQRLLKGEFKPKDPTEHGRMQRAFRDERPTPAQIADIKDPATRVMIAKWSKMFPAKPEPKSMFLDVETCERPTGADGGWPFPLGGWAGY